MKKEFCLNLLWHLSMMLIIGCTFVHALTIYQRINPTFLFSLQAGMLGLSIYLIPILLISVVLMVFIRKNTLVYFWVLWILWLGWIFVYLPAICENRRYNVNYKRSSPFVNTIKAELFGLHDSDHPILGEHNSRDLRRVRRSKYFPKGVFSKENLYDGYFRDYLGMHLYSMKESSLNKRHPKHRLIARLHYNPTFSDQLLMKVEIDIKQRTGTFIVKQSNGKMGYVGDKIVFEKQINLEGHELDWFLNNLNSLPTLDLKEHYRNSVDGTLWSLEIVKDGEYTVQGLQFSQTGDIFPVAKQMFRLLHDKIKLDTDEFKYFLDH